MVTFQFIPYTDIEDLSSAKRINKLMNVVKQNKIVVLEGRLKKEEETDLIEITMEEVGEKFKGIELAVIYPDKDSLPGMKRFKYGLASILLGDRSGLTVIGPASIVKKVKKNPTSIELQTSESKKRKR